MLVGRKAQLCFIHAVRGEQGHLAGLVHLGLAEPEIGLVRSAKHMASVAPRLLALAVIVLALADDLWHSSHLDGLGRRSCLQVDMLADKDGRKGTLFGFLLVLRWIPDLFLRVDFVTRGRQRRECEFAFFIRSG